MVSLSNLLIMTFDSTLKIKFKSNSSSYYIK